MNNNILLWPIRFIPGIFLINWMGWVPCLANQIPILPLPKPALKAAPLLADERVFLLKQYDTAVVEIRLRLEQEHHLFFLSFTIAGSVIGYGIGTYFFEGRYASSVSKQGLLQITTRTQPSASGLESAEDPNLFPKNLGAKQSQEAGHRPPAQNKTKRRSAKTVMMLACWGAVFATGIIDLRQQYNVDIIVQLGTWIQSVEGILLPPNVGWEKFIANVSPLWRGPLYPLLQLSRELLIWVLFVTALQLFSVGNQLPSMKQASYFGMQISWLLFALISVHYNYNYWLNLIICFLMWLGAFALSTWWYLGTANDIEVLGQVEVRV